MPVRGTVPSVGGLDMLGTVSTPPSLLSTVPHYSLLRFLLSTLRAISSAASKSCTASLPLHLYVRYFFSRLKEQYQYIFLL
jgi:hypothetical protein